MRKVCGISTAQAGFSLPTILLHPVTQYTAATQASWNSQGFKCDDDTLYIIIGIKKTKSRTEYTKKKLDLVFKFRCNEKTPLVIQKTPTTYYKGLPWSIVGNQNPKP